MKYIKLIRLHHWIKNLLIFFPLVFSGQLLNASLLTRSCFGFLAYGCLSSITYIYNDIRDIESDRRHEVKKNRPLASGAVTATSAVILAVLLFCFVILFQYLAAGFSLYPWLCLIAYFLLNIGYSSGLKNVPLIDITILVSGFLLRVLYGSTITEIAISHWLYLTVMSMAFYLSLGKRRNELMMQKGNTRKVLAYYNKNFLDKNMYLCLGLTITFYTLWAIDPVTVQRISSSNLIWTVPLVILICMKYSLNVEDCSHGDPVDVVLGDKWLMLLVALFAALTLGIIYL